MPQRPPKLCAHPGCGAKVPSGYCDRHKKVRYRQDSRPPAHERGYDNRWTKFRKLYLARHPFCVRCEQEGKTKVADMIHHVIPLADGGEQYDEGNLQGLCDRHHREIHKFGGKGLK